MAKETTFASFLRFRKGAVDLSGLETKYNLILPPIFKAFIQTFEGISGDIYLDPNGELQTLTYYDYHAHKLNNKDLLFNGFLAVEMIFESHRSSDTWVENGLIPISEHDHGGTILVGIAEENLDRLFFEYSNGIEFIEENIFTFIGNMSPKIEYEGNLSSVFKQWEEDFWRLK